MRELKRASGRGARLRGTQRETPREKRVRFPAWAAGLAPDRFALLVVGAALLGAVLVLLRQASYGPGMLADGLSYVMAARGLLAGDGLDGYWGNWIYQPPLYPAMLASGGLLGLDPYAFAGPLNAVVFGLTVLVAGRWLRRHLRSRLLWLWGCISIALALPLAEVASHALSESAFILFVVLALTQVAGHLDSGGRASLIWAAVFSALACLTRYVGASVILSVVPLLLAAPVATRKKIEHIAVYTLIAVVPVGLWMLRNFLIAGSLTGARGQAFYALPFIADEALQVAVGHSWLAGLTAPVLLALVMALGHMLRRRSDSGRTRDAPVVSEFARMPLCVFGGFALTYLTLLVAVMMLGAVSDGLERRFLAPVYVPLLLTALLLMDGASGRRGSGRSVRSFRVGGELQQRVLAALLSLVLCLQAAWLVALHGRALVLWNAGVRQGFVEPRWVKSESLRHFQEAALTGTTLSNAYGVMRLYAHGPARHYGLPCEPDRLRAALRNVRGAKDVHVLFFSEGDGWRGCSRQQDDDLRDALFREPLLELVTELADGKLYRLRTRESLPPAMFQNSDRPIEGKLFAAGLTRPHADRVLGQPWRWEKGSDATGWTSLPVQRPTYTYTPTAADVGQRLRASVYYADRLGNRVKAIAGPSEPVQAVASEADLILRSGYDVYLRGNRLIYENRRCGWEDEYGTRFLLTVYSLYSENGTPERATLHFAWSRSSWLNGTCITERQLPDTAIVGIRTGQVDRDGNLLWKAEHWFENYATGVGSFDNVWEAEFRR